MKKSDLKAQAKTAKKTAAKNIERDLVTELKKMTAVYGSSKELTKVIEKGAKQLAKKIGKEIKIAVPAATDMPAPKVKKASSATASQPIKAAAQATPIKTAKAKPAKNTSGK